MVPLGAAEAALQAFKSAGGVVEHVLVQVTGELQDEERHRLAVIAGLSEIARRWEDWVSEKMAQTGEPRDRFRRIEVTPSLARGHRIDLDTFVGRAYDHQTDCIVSLWTLAPGGSAGGKSGKTQGYAEAFSDPPYSVQANLDQLNAWFESINRSLFGGLSSELRIWEWDTNWASWFEDGHEWWGSFCWTVQAPGSPLVTVIGASATD